MATHSQPTGNRYIDCSNRFNTKPTKQQTIAWQEKFSLNDEQKCTTLEIIIVVFSFIHNTRKSLENSKMQSESTKNPSNIIIHHQMDEDLPPGGWLTFIPARCGTLSSICAPEEGKKRTGYLFQVLRDHRMYALEGFGIRRFCVCTARKLGVENMHFFVHTIRISPNLHYHNQVQIRLQESLYEFSEQNRTT